jgi:hypothetical protein
MCSQADVFSSAEGDLLNKLQHGPQELQLPHKPPRHNKNDDTDSGGEQHREHRTAHPAKPAAAIATNEPLMRIMLPLYFSMD